MTFEEDHLTRPYTVEVNVFMGSKVLSYFHWAEVRGGLTFFTILLGRPSYWVLEDR